MSIFNDSRFLAYKDKQHFPLILGRFYYSPIGKLYQVIQDNDGDFALATWEGIENKQCECPETAVIEKLTDEIAQTLEGEQWEKRYETITLEKQKEGEEL